MLLNNLTNFWNFAYLDGSSCSIAILIFKIALLNIITSSYAISGHAVVIKKVARQA